MADTPEQDKPKAAEAAAEAKPGAEAKPEAAAHAAPRVNAPPPRSLVRGFFSGFFKIRDEPTTLGRALMAGLCLGLILFGWWFVTRGGPAEQRIISPTTLGSPAEVFGSFHSLWFERALTRNAVASLVRVVEGFGLALLIGIPLGVLGGCFRRISSFLAPITIFGRSVPVAALVPLTVLWFGIDELQKVIFLFIACVAFVIYDTTTIISEVNQKYLDTAATLGASRSQTIFKVLLPLALPDIFNSMRLLFGLGFGYIILAEVVNMDSGLGMLIAMSRRRSMSNHVYLSLLVIALMAYLIDRLLYWMGKQLFPYRFRD